MNNQSKLAYRCIKSVYHRIEFIYHRIKLVYHHIKLHYQRIKLHYYHIKPHYHHTKLHYDIRPSWPSICTRPSLFDTDILQHTVSDLKFSTRSVPVDIFNKLKRKNFLPKKMQRK